MKKTLLTLSFFLFVISCLFAQEDVVINEIMFAPSAGSGKEWFEIYNYGTAPVNLRNWKWKDSVSALRLITSSNVILAQNTFAIVCEDSSALKAFYPNFGGYIFQTVWNTLNNGQDSIVVLDSSNNRIDFVAYRSSWGGSSGNRSLERILPSGPSNIHSNWGTCSAPDGATPNLRNSLTPKNSDLSLNKISFSVNFPSVNESLAIIANIKNRGLISASNYWVSFYNDRNRDSVPQEGELISTVNSVGTLSPGDSINYASNTLTDSAGLRLFIAKVNYPPDEDTSNNRKTAGVFVSGAGGPDSVVINEIMYAPSGGLSKEWFELYNRGADPVNINGWKWKDGSSSFIVITVQNFIIPGNGFAVICEDSAAVRNFYPSLNGIVVQTPSWASLNNTGDKVIVVKTSGQLADSVEYVSAWGGSTGNKSLERVLHGGPSNQQSNWGACMYPAGATPNGVNSISPKPHDLEVRRIVFSKSMPAQNDTIGIKATVKNRGLNISGNFTVLLYEDFNLDSIPSPGELFLSINSASALNPGDTAIFNASRILDSSGLRQFIVKVFYPPDNDTVNNALTSGINVTGGSTAGRILINEIMYDPPQGEPEWVELFNNSASVFHLRNWKIQDNGAAQCVITPEDYFLGPMDMVVITSSDSIFIAHPGLPPGKVIINNSIPDLNNSTDAVKIFRSTGALSDRVDYLNGWGGENASLERLSVMVLSQDSLNWFTSIDCENSTPSRVNSISTAASYSEGDLVVNEIMASPFAGEAEWIELYNPSGKNISLSGWMMHETGGRFVITDTCRAIIRPGQYVVFASDTTIFSRFPYLIYRDSTIHVFIYSRTSAASLGLNNDADEVKITDIFRNTIDSVYYNEEWHNPNIQNTTGVSLEKINHSLPSNNRDSWSSCTLPSGGSPGLANSIFTAVPNSFASVNISPNPFSPDGDGYEDFAIISYRLVSSIAQVRIRIFDIKGRLLRVLLNNQPSGPGGTVVFDGLDEEKRKLRLGIYIVLLEAIDSKNGIAETVKTTVVVAAKL